ncbi:MAG: calcium/sodium antiporter [Candidatus Thermoplasmatota archaeon]
MIPAGLEILTVPSFILGILFLYKGSDILVDGTAKTAAQLGVSALIISVIIVAFGTSAPEFAISVGAAAQNHGDISVGNIIGSCIANLLLVLGASAIIKPIPINKSTIRREMPIMIIVTILLLFFSYFALLDRYHVIGGLLFLFLFVIFILFFLRIAKKEKLPKVEYNKGELQKNVVFIILGIAGVIAGAQLLIESSVTIARFFGLSEIIIALSMVAIGTSLPELVVSVVASYKDEADIAVGNVIGSNIFNIFLVLGAAALLIPLNVAASFDYLLILLGVTLIMFPIVYTGNVISRKEGVFMLLFYVVFIWYTFFGYTII